MGKTIKGIGILLFAGVFGTFLGLNMLGVDGTEPFIRDRDVAAEPAADALTETADPLGAEDFAEGETPDLQREPKENEIVTVLIELKGEPLLETATERGLTVMETASSFDGNKLSDALDTEYKEASRALSKYIEGEGYRYTAVLNAFSARVRYGDISAIEKSEYVKRVALSNTFEAPKAITENVVNVHDTGIFNADGVGYDGTGTVVAVLDTGTDYTHEVFDMELDPATMAISKDDVAAAVPLLTATALSASRSSPEEIDEDDLYLSSKLPYGYDYADMDTNVYPVESHGTHVAGIISGKSDRITGVAPRTQIATFKVFPDATGGAETEDILAALNDAVVLGVDAINMSLGASCGFAREGDDDLTNEAYDRVENAGICLVTAASNDYSSAYGSTYGNTNLATNPDSGTVGSPASYHASLAVASVSGVKTPYMNVNGEEVVYFRESRRTGQVDSNKFVEEILGDRQDGEFGYVVIPGVGYEANYTGLDVNGKIAVVKRGSNSFEEKVKIAAQHGAAGVIVYNNLSGMINMSVGTKKTIPSCFINMDFGKYFVEHETGTVSLSKDYLAGPFMSDFSSWGPLPNLELTPDITAHGGEITSSFPGGNEYGTISGTSMACPNLAGALILVREYVKNLEGDRSASEVRDLSYSLMMSTATVARNEDGNPYSPRKQGAGIADIARSVSTKAYLTVDGSNKPKISYGDDPDRTGEYALKFNVVNMTGESLSYKIDPIVMTESMSSDGITVAEMAYLLNASSSYAVEAKQGTAKVNGDALLLGGYAEAALTVTITLSQEDRDYLNTTFANGMFVEGYIVLRSYNADKIDLNLPYLAFYGNWADAPMLDVSEYEVGESAVDSSVLAEDKLLADVYGTLPMGGFDMTDDYNVPYVATWGLGAFGYNIARGYEQPATRERYASLTVNQGGNYLLNHIALGLLRGAKRVDMEIRDSVTGELIWQKTDYNARKAHSSGGDPQGGSAMVEFNVRDYNLPNNARYTFSMSCYLDWGDGNQGNRNTFSFEFTIDNEKPVLLNTYVRDTGNRKQVEFNVYDNHYLQGFIVYTYESENNGSFTGLTSLTSGVVPVYDGERNGTTRVSLDVTQYWSKIQKNGGKLYVQFMDYAKNSDQFFVTLEECNDVRLEKTRSARDDYTIATYGQIDLEEYVRVYANVEGEYLEDYWVKDLVWTSDTPSVAEVKDGLVTGLHEGDAVITVTPDGGGTPLTFNIHVTAQEQSIGLREIELSDYSLRLERGETFTISATVHPYNYEGEYVLSWRSSSSNVQVTVDPADQTKATVKAIDSGSATISVQIEGTYVNASCSVRVEEEYYVDGVYLRSYTGRGDENGVVEIPDDLGIVYIYPQAFFGNEYITKVIIPEGVTTIMRAAIYGCDNLEEIVLPESCEELQTFACAWNPKLTKINLEKVKIIGSRALISDTALETVDLSSTTYIKDLAFANDSALRSVDLSKVGVVGQQAFYNCTGLSELVIPSHTSTAQLAFGKCTGLAHLVVYADNVGAGAFYGCTGLTDVMFMNDVDIIDLQAFDGCTALTDVQFLGTVYEIGNLAFRGCNRLQSITLPAGLSKVGSQVFLNCSRLGTIRIHRDADITSAGLAAFYGAGNLVSFEVEEGNKYLSSEEGVLYDRAKYTLLMYPYGKNQSAFTVPDSVRVIGSSAFYGVQNVQTIDLNNTERVEADAFRACTAEFTGFEHLKYIGDEAFAQSSSATTSIKTLPIGESLEYIGEAAFAYCVGLTEKALVIPDSVKFVGAIAFYGCPFESVDLGTLETVGESAFAHCTRLTKVNFGENFNAIPDAMFGTCRSLTSIVIPNTVRSIGINAFRECSSLSEITLPDGLERIEANTFNGCSALTEIDLPSSVKYLGEGAFDLTALGSIDLNNVEYIGSNAFRSTHLQNVSSDSVRTVGDGAFSAVNVSGSTALYVNNPYLASVSFPSATTVGERAFYRCTNLTTVELPAAKEIGAEAFRGCNQLRTVTLVEVNSIGDGAFYGDSGISSLVLPELVGLGAEAFSGTSVSSLTLPASFRTAENRAFAGMAMLKNIEVDGGNPLYFGENGVLYRRHENDKYTLVAYPQGKEDTEFTVKKRTVKIGAYAFTENKHLKTVVLPEHLSVIGAGAFYGVSLLNTLVINAVAAPTLESLSPISGTTYGDNVYNNFVETLGSRLSLKVIVPANGTGYDSYLWRSYVGEVSAEGEVRPNASSLDFMDRAARLSALEGDALAAEVEALERLYRVMDTTQQNFVTGGYDGTNYYELLQNAKARIPAAPETPEEEGPSDKGALWLWIGIGVGGAALVGCAAALTVMLVRRKRRMV